MTLNGVIALILRYFTEFESFEDKLKMSAEYRLPPLAKADPPCSAVSLRQLSYLFLTLMEMRMSLWGSIFLVRLLLGGATHQHASPLRRCLLTLQMSVSRGEP